VLANIVGQRGIRVALAVFHYPLRRQLGQGGAQPVEFQVSLQRVIVGQALLCLGQTCPIVIAGGVQRFFKRTVAVVGAGQGRH
jgi:hypothetical protein